MQRPHHGDGLVITGGLSIDPPLDEEGMDLLDLIASLSLRAALRDAPSPLLEKLAPGCPDGPSAWVTCQDGCCLELDGDGYTRIDAIEPWLQHIVGSLFARHRFEGHIVWWDTVDRDFTALGVDREGRVRRRSVLEREGRPAPRTGNGTSDRRLRGV